MAQLHRLFFQNEYDKYIKTLPIGDQIKIHEEEEAQEAAQKEREKHDASIKLLMYMLLRTDDRIKFLAERRMLAPTKPRNTDMSESPLAKYTTSGGFVPEEGAIGYAVMPEDIQPLIDVCIAQCVTPNVIRIWADRVMKLSQNPNSSLYPLFRERTELLLETYIEWSKRYNRGSISSVCKSGLSAVIEYHGKFFTVCSNKIYDTGLQNSDGTTGFFATLIRGVFKMHDTPEDHLILAAKQMRNGHSRVREISSLDDCPVCFSFDEDGEIDKVIVIDPLYYTDELYYLHKNGINCGLNESEE